MPVVFITGGARRIGRGLALLFAQRGYDVGFTYHTSESDAQRTMEDVRALGAKCETAQCDVRDVAGLTTAMHSLAIGLDTPDVIISNAGMYPPRRTLAQISVDDLENTFSVNTTPLLTIAKAYGSMLEGEDRTGRLIAMSSLGAVEIWKDRMDYHVSKAALVTLVKTLARSMAPQVAVNTVAPGSIIFPEEPNDADGGAAPITKIPMGRQGTADDIFDAVWFFATASSYITGQFIAVDGGYHLVR